MLSNLNKEQGFTFLEALLSLFVSALALLLLTSGIMQADKLKRTIIDDSQNVNENTAVISGDRQVEWHLFLNQLETYLEGTVNPTIHPGDFVVEEWNATTNRFEPVTYTRPSSRLSVFIRRKNSGTQYMLTGIKTMDFQQLEDGWFLIDVTFRNGENYEGRIKIDSWVRKEESAKHTE